MDILVLFLLLIAFCYVIFSSVFNFFEDLRRR